MTSPTARLLALLGALALATLVGLLVRRRSGRSRAVVDGHLLTERDLGVPPGVRATLLQLSSEVCAPCRATARVLGALAAEHEGVRHLELDVATRLDLADRLSVVRTPTVLLLDPTGREVGRTSGAMTAAQARAALAPLVGDEGSAAGTGAAAGAAR